MVRAILIAGAALLASVLTLASWVWGLGGAVAEQPASTSARIGASFSPDRLGARASVSFSIHFSGGSEGIPSPVRKAVVELPGGLGLQFPATRGCTVAHLLAHGAQGCPDNSLAGHGHAFVEAKTGATVQTEHATVWAFVGPLQSGQPTLQIFGEGITPIERRVAFTMHLAPDHPPYWAKLEGVIPAIPTVPLEPDASTVNFSLTVGLAHGRRGSIGIFVPHRCPAGGFPWAAHFAYADGSTSDSAIHTRCP